VPLAGLVGPSVVDRYAEAGGAPAGGGEAEIGISGEVAYLH